MLPLFFLNNKYNHRPKTHTPHRNGGDRLRKPSPRDINAKTRFNFLRNGVGFQGLSSI